MITQTEVSKVAYKEQVSERTIEKDYVITWILLALADSKFRNLLAFKGGTALKKIYFPDYRYSEDLDFTLIGKTSPQNIIEEFKIVLKNLEKAQAFTFALPDKKIEEREDSLTVYVEFVGPLLAKLGSRDIKVDFTLKEKLLLLVEKKPITSFYSDSKHLHKSFKAYSLEEILTEKLCALIGRTEPRDLYDTYFLLDLGQLDYQSVSQAFPEKAQNKKINPERLSTILTEREAVISKMWEVRLKHQVKELPHLDKVMRKTNQYLRRYGII